MCLADQCFYQDTISRWFPTKAEEQCTCPWNQEYRMPCIKLHQEVFRVTQHGDGDQYFYWGILSTRLLTKALEQFTSPWKEDYTLEGYTFEIKLHFVIFISTLHLIWKKNTENGKFYYKCTDLWYSQSLIDSLVCARILYFVKVSFPRDPKHIWDCSDFWILGNYSMKKRFVKTIS